MATGEIRATMALTEPGGGSDLQAIRTVARRVSGADSDGGYVINGAKTWITNARRSQLVALLCKTDPEARPQHQGITILLVEHGPRLHRLPGPAEAGLQGRGVLRAGLRRLPRPRGERCSAGARATASPR